MEVLQADLEVAHATVERLEVASGNAVSSRQAELAMQQEAHTTLQQQYKEAQQQITSLQSQQVALEESCNQHKQQVVRQPSLHNRPAPCHCCTLLPFLVNRVYTHLLALNAA